MNNFRNQLDWSHEQGCLPMWEEVYRSAFPTFAGMQAVNQDGWAQRAGIDRQVFLADGTVLRIDEKSRKGAWSDILLEYWSDYERRKPGWIGKPAACDFIAYAFIPVKTCYLLPFQTLRLAWYRNRASWAETYPTVKARNDGYTTHSCPVPIAVLLDAIRDAMVVHWISAVAVDGAA